MVLILETSAFSQLNSLLTQGEIEMIFKILCHGLFSLPFERTFDFLTLTDIFSDDCIGCYNCS
jgi:hypothetical protein